MGADNPDKRHDIKLFYYILIKDHFTEALLQYVHMGKINPVFHIFYVHF